ncbi:SPX domain protein involved in polyphosphate accumulation [Chryseobacterium sp. 16F]|uniref:SPX domain protein involved in polyphosphate accumulation n=1 Tax=Frigoriflavimonas asaccharolytica TaxID=2735899 RepID=A0A8J8GAV7_9FLAO|nr:SPX domain protein involved in polyphosphate accumulation [Frigoriflavimonas asaccharolytica]
MVLQFLKEADIKNENLHFCLVNYQKRIFVFYFKEFTCFYTLINTTFFEIIKQHSKITGYQMKPQSE